MPTLNEIAESLVKRDIAKTKELAKAAISANILAQGKLFSARRVT